MTTKIMQRLAGKVSVVIMVALLIAAVGTYGLSNSKHDSSGRATAAVSPSKVEVAPVANKSVSVGKDVSVSVRTTSTSIQSAPVQSASAPVTTALSTAPPEVVKAQVTPLADARATYARLPLSFIPNQGQLEKGVEFEARGSGYITSLTSDAAYIGLHSTPKGAEPVKQSLVKIGFANAGPMNFVPSEKQTSYANYIGGPASHWKDHVPNYGRVTASNVYPGVDATFYGNRSHLQFDFVVKPGADPKAIQLKLDGGQVKLDENGDLAVATELGTVYQRKPVLYQEVNGVRQPVDGSYKLNGDTVSFEVGAYDASRTLTIDPVINFSLVVGGGTVGIGDTALNAVASDLGAVYVVGTTSANTLNLGGATSTISGARAASTQTDAILVSFTLDGSTVNWYTFIGGSLQDSGYGVAVEDPTTNTSTTLGFPNAQFGIYVVGQTFSNDLALNAPATNAYQGGGDGFVIRLTGAGALAAGPKYIGGPNGDSATSVAVRCVNGCSTAHANQDSVYVGMSVQSTLVTPGGLSTAGSFGGGTQAGGIVELRADNLGVSGAHGNVYYVGAAQSATVTALALTPFPTINGNLQVEQRLAFAGNVLGTGSPVSGGLLNKTNTIQGGHGGTDGDGYGGGAQDGFWGVINTAFGGTPLTSLSNLDYIGGAGNDNVKGVAVLPDGNLVVVGDTDTLPFTTTGAGGVLTGSGACGTTITPATNCSFGSTGTAASGGAQDVVAVVINSSGIGAQATANVGTQAAGTAQLGTPANAYLTVGNQAISAPAAAGVAATPAVTMGTPATFTITPGNNVQVTIAQGANSNGTLNLVGNSVASISFNPGSGYWNIPTVTITGGTCTTQPSAHALLVDPPGHPTADGTIAAIIVDNGGVCTAAPTGVTITPAGIQGFSVNAGSTGYQGNTTITFTNPLLDGTCTGTTAVIKTPGASSLINQSFASGPLTPVSGAPAAGQFNAGSCSAQPTTAGTNTNINGSTSAAAGIQALNITAAANSGYQGGNTVSASFNGTCGSFPVAAVTVPGVASDQTLAAGNILTNSGLGCTTQPTVGTQGAAPATAPTGTFLTNPGLATAGVSTGGTGYSTIPAQLPAVTAVPLSGSCTTNPGISVQNANINNVAGNLTGLTLSNSGQGCLPGTTFTVTVDPGGVTNINFPACAGCNQGTQYNTVPAVTLDPPTPTPGAGHCNVTATATASISGGHVTAINLTNPGCGYPAGDNPTVHIGGPSLTVTDNVGNPITVANSTGTGYSASAPPTVSLNAGWPPVGVTCSTNPTFGTPTISAVNGSTGGNITGIPITNSPSCTTGGAGLTATTTPLVFSTLPGIVSINAPSTAGDSYNVAPTMTFPSCSTAPVATAILAGPAPNSVGSTFTISSYGANCTGPNPTTVNYSHPGLKSPGTAFTITNPGLGYATAPTVTVSGCTTAPQATSALAVPPGNPGTVASITLNTTTSGGNGCGDAGPVNVVIGNPAPGIAALDYLGGLGNDFGNGVVTDPNSNIYITGQTASSNFPVITNPAWTGSTALKGATDGFVARITESGGTIQGNNGGGFSTYFGGTSNDTFNAISGDFRGNIYLAGQTWSADFPVTQGQAFSGNSDGTLTNLGFNNMVVGPQTSASFSTAFATPTGTCNVGTPCSFTVNFVNSPGPNPPYSVAGGPLGGTPGTAITYSANSGATTWLTITQSAGGFTLSVNPGTGASGLAPDNYTATFLISAPNSDTPPVTFTVNLSVSATFTVFNCTSNAQQTACTNGTATPVSNFNYTYTKAEANAGTVTPAQQMLVGLVGMGSGSAPGAYPAPGTFTAKVNYNTNNALIAAGNTSVAATNANFKWFNIAGADCSGVAGCTDAFGTNLALTINPAVLDTLAISGNGITLPAGIAAGSITFTQVNAGGGGINSITITVTATVTPRLVFSGMNGTEPASLGYAFSCNSAPPAACSTINASSTNRALVWGMDDVINITSNGNANKMAILSITSSPSGGSAACFSGAPGGVQVPNGSYQAPSSIDPTASPLSLPIQINMNSGNAACVQGVYTGTVTISGAPANLGAGDSIQTNITNIAALGPNDSPAATGTVTIPVTITLGNELQSCNNNQVGSACTSPTVNFPFGTYNINSQEGRPGTGCTPGTACASGNAIPANQTGTVSLTLPPSPFGAPTTYTVKCTVAAIAGLYTPVSGSASSSSTATCDWLTATISNNSLSGNSSASLTVGVTTSGANNLTVLPTNGGPNGNTYSGTIQLIYQSGTLAGNSLIYPVTVTVVRQPLNWNITAGGNPPSTTFSATVGSGVPANQACGSLFSNENFTGAVTGEYVAFNPRQVGLRLAALANQTFAAANVGTGAAGATQTAGWLTVSQNPGTAGINVAASDALTCSVNILNLAPGTYTACIDAVDLGGTASASGPSPAFSAAATTCDGAWPETGGTAGGRTIGVVTLNLSAAPPLNGTPTGFNFSFQQGSGGNAGFQTGGGFSANGATLTLTNGSATANIQNVVASTSLPWLSLGGATSTPNLAAGANAAVTLNVTPPVTPGTYSGLITLSCANCTLNPATIPVTLTVVGQPTITTVPGTLTNFTFQQGGPTPASQNLVVNLTSGTGNVTMTPTSGSNWLQVCAGPNCTPAAAATAATPISTSGVQFSVAVDPNVLNTLAASNTPYAGSVSISVPGATNTPVVLNVSVTVIAQSTLVSSANGTSFSFTVGGTVVPTNQTLSVSTTTTSGQAATAGFTLTPTSQSNWLWINGAATAVANTATITPLNYVISVNPTALTTLANSVPAGSSQTFNGSIAIATTTPPAGSVTPTSIAFTLTISSQPIINISNCSASSFAYTLTSAAPSPASITCTVSNSSSVVGINTLAVVGCPGSWETCTLGATTLAASGSTTLTLTPTNLANQNPGTFGPPNITITGASAGQGGGPAITGNVPGISITNTPLITVPTTQLTYGPFTQGNLQTPGNQQVSGNLAEGSGGTPAGPGAVGTGVITSVVSASSFAAGSCTGGVTTGPTNWLAVTQAPMPAAGSGSTATNYTLTIAVNPGVFPTLTSAATCTGAITVSSSGVTPAAVTKTIPVTFTINPQSGFTVSDAAGTITPGGNFNANPTIVNGYPVNLTSTAPAVPMTVSSSPTQGQQYTVTIQPVTGGNWLTASACTVAVPCTANASTPGFNLGVAAAANTLSAGQYFATVSVASANSSSSPNNTVTFTVTLTVDATAALSVTQTGGLTTPYYPFFTTPGTWTLGVTSASPTSGAPATPAQFTVTQTALNGSTPNNLLVINGTQPYTTPASVTLTYSSSVANTLPAGIYGGTVTVTVSQSGVTTNPQSVAIPWSITINPEALIQTAPSAATGVIINCILGQTCNASIGVSATSAGNPVNIPVAASVTSLPTPWLSVVSSPSTANGASIQVAANTVGLQANTSYAGQIVVTSNAAANSPYTVPVTLNVQPPPTCSFTATSPISLTSAGTSTGGVLPQTPASVSITPNSSCPAGMTFAVTSSVPWISATGGTGVTFTALSNPHSTAQSGTMTITSPSAVGVTVTVTVNEAASTAPQSPNRQVTALYQTILGRDPDAGGYSYWTTSGLPLGYMADGFFTSPEAFNTDFGVIAAYQAATGAPPSYAQFLAAITSVRAGTQTVAGLFSSLIASNSSFNATNLYHNLLNRTPTTAESNACTVMATCFQTLIGAPASTAPVSATNNEFQSTGTFVHGADHTNGLFVTMLYFTILNRDPDQGGYNFWLGIANGGGPGILFQGAAGQGTRIQILGPGTQGQGFIGSNEFVSDYQ